MKGGYVYETMKALMAGQLSLTPSLPIGGAELILAALGGMRERYQWSDMTDGEWDDLDALLAETENSLMTSAYLGAVWPFAGALPDNVELCDGSLLLAADYPELAAVISPNLIAGGWIEKPDLTDMFIMGGGGQEIGDTGGEDFHTLTVAEMPAHVHSWSQYTYGIDIEGVGVPDPTGVGQPELPRSTGSTGGNGSHNNLPPYYVLVYGMVVR